MGWGILYSAEPRLVPEPGQTHPCGGTGFGRQFPGSSPDHDFGGKACHLGYYGQDPARLSGMANPHDAGNSGGDAGTRSEEARDPELARGLGGFSGAQHD